MALPITDADLSATAMRLFFRLAEAWQLVEEQQRWLLGDPDSDEYEDWRVGSVARLSPPVLERISYLIGIYKALHTLFPVAAQADSWIRRPSSNLAFEGRSALDVMCTEGVEGLALVRGYLGAQLGDEVAQ